MTEDKKQALIARSQARLKAAILPTQGSSRALRDSPPPIAIKPPDWFVWRNTPRAEPWQACTLALNYEPDSVDHGFPSEEEADKYTKLEQMLNANQNERQHFSQNFAMGVRLNEFAAWCIHIDYCIPPELAALAKAAHKAAAKVEAAPAKAVPAITPKGGTNKKVWDDSRLRALWDESILPGVTKTSLSKKHSVTRQRIGALLKKAKNQFSTMRTHASKNVYGHPLK